jgi:two-component system OmpR family response regulator
MNSARLLMIEDDIDLAENVIEYLEQSGYKIEHHDSGKEALNGLESDQFDLVILDIGLPDSNGIDICKALRESGFSAPVMFLTGQTDSGSKILGLRAEADDYLCKPFELDELGARVKALLRRGASNLIGDTLVHKGVSLSTREGTISFGTKQIKLAPREANFLEFLMRNPGKVYKSSELLDHVWRSDSSVSSESVRSCVSFLRKKLSGAEFPPMIDNIPAQGYRLSD